MISGCGFYLSKYGDRTISVTRCMAYKVLQDKSTLKTMQIYNCIVYIFVGARACKVCVCVFVYIYIAFLDTSLIIYTETDACLSGR